MKARKRKFWCNLIKNRCCDVSLNTCLMPTFITKAAFEQSAISIIYALPADFYNTMAESNDTVKTSLTKSGKQKEKIYAVVFLSTVASISALAGFTRAVAAARRQDPKYFGDGISGIKGLQETGASLAIRALGWGTLYAVTGCGLFFYGIWKISGATNAEEFRFKMGSLLPKIPKNDPPQSRTEFEGLTDLLTYISEDWGRNKEE